MIYLDSISKLYGEKSPIIALRDISFTRTNSQITGILGKNGAGKTTLLKMMMGLISPTSGTININNFNPYHKKKEFLRTIGFVSGQKSVLDPYITVYESLMLLGIMYGLDTYHLKKIINYYAEKLSIKAILHKSPRELSLGERMKSEIIASLYHNPKVVFLDEPSVGLDFASQKELYEIIKEFQYNNNSLIFLTSHHIQDITELCQSILVIDQNTIQFDGSIADLPHNSTNIYINSLLNELNI
jgi:ABC-2 type transport system ATP-binding protein